METSDDFNMAMSFPILNIHNGDLETADDENRDEPISSKPESGLIETIGDLLFMWTLRGLDRDDGRNDNRNITEERLRGIKQY